MLGSATCPSISVCVVPILDGRIWDRRTSDDSLPRRSCHVNTTRPTFGRPAGRSGSCAQIASLVAARLGAAHPAHAGRYRYAQHRAVPGAVDSHPRRRCRIWLARAVRGAIALVAHPVGVVDSGIHRLGLLRPASLVARRQERHLHRCLRAGDLRPLLCHPRHFGAAHPFAPEPVHYGHVRRARRGRLADGLRPALRPAHTRPARAGGGRGLLGARPGRGARRHRRVFRRRAGGRCG